MMGLVLVNSALITVGSGVGVLILFKGCSLVGRYIAETRKAQSVSVVPESVEEQFLVADRIRSLRNRTTQLRADEAARAG